MGPISITRSRRRLEAPRTGAALFGLALVFSSCDHDPVGVTAIPTVSLAAMSPEVTRTTLVACNGCQTFAPGISDNSTIVGAVSFFDQVGNQVVHAAKWVGGVFTDIGDGPVPFTSGEDVNDAGLIVGRANGQAAIYTGGQWIGLATNLGGRCYRVNAAGTALCNAEVGHPYRTWNAGTTTNLPLPADAFPLDLDDQGVMVGYQGSLGSAVAPLRIWPDGTVIPLPLPSGATKGSAWAVSPSGRFVAGRAENSQQIILWDAGQVAYYGHPFGMSGTGACYAHDVTDRGHIVGFCLSDGGFVRAGGVTYALGPVTEWLSNAQRLSINKMGQVVGQAVSGSPFGEGTLWTYPLAPDAVAGGPYAGAEGSAIAFDGSQSSDPGGNPLTFAWDFGDGYNATGATPTHAYQDDGTYTVTLTVSNGTSSSQVSTQAVITNAAPVVNAGTDRTVSLGAPVALQVAFSDAGVLDGPWGYAVDWGDGGSPTTGSAADQSTPIGLAHTYAATGVYPVSVSITDADGGSGSDQLSVTVVFNQAPVPVIAGPAAGITGVPIAYSGAGSSDPDGDPITAYDWAFGDGATGSGPAVSHTYANPGNYPVTLTVTDARGATASAGVMTAVVTNAAPVVQFTSVSPPGLTGDALQVSGLIVDATNPSGTWTVFVDWGDNNSTGPILVARHPSIPDALFGANHAYTAPGVYSVTVRATDQFGAEGSAPATLTAAQSVGIDVDAACPKKAGVTTICRQGGATIVAIPGAAGFDVSQVDTRTVTLGDNLAPEVPPLSCGVLNDQNRDGSPDLYCFFSRAAVAGTLPATTNVTVYFNARLLSGVPIQGRELVRRLR